MRYTITGYGLPCVVYYYRFRGATLCDILLQVVVYLLWNTITDLDGATLCGVLLDVMMGMC